MSKIRINSLMLFSTLTLCLTACSKAGATDPVSNAGETANNVSEMANKQSNKQVNATMSKNYLSAEELTALEESDPYRWLENVEGEKALAWVEERNKISKGHLEAMPIFAELNAKNLAVYDSKEKIAYPSFSGDYVYNFWKDEKHTRGISRRTSLDEYLSGDPNWEVVIDVDAIAALEEKNWVYKGSTCLYPENTRCILSLSDGGTDAVIRREYDLNSKSFIEDGFILEESKGGVDWIDSETLIVGVDFGEGTMTESGYPNIVKVWKRGTPLEQAQTIFTGDKEDVGSWGYIVNTPDGDYTFVRRSKTFFTGETHYYKGGKLTKLDLQDDARIGAIFKGQMLITLKSDWKTGGQHFKQGSLVSINFENFLAGKRNFTVLHEPTERSSIAGYSTTKDYLFVNVLNNVRSEIVRFVYDQGSWKNSPVETPKLGQISVVAADDNSNNYFFTYTGFLNPNTLYHVNDNGKQRKIKSLPDFFDASKYKTEQFESTSKDGTKVPYFMISTKELELDGKNPTVMYGYGGFEVSLTPSYSATTGMDWMDQGGVYVLTNIRGGGEFGPKWHQAALHEKRPRAYEDFISIAEDLIAKKVTSPEHLGIVGGSNGGLLVGAIYTMRPDLFNAVVCRVPLLDMKRYNKLLAGASWMGEYGDPDIPEQWNYISQYSPYHNLSKDKKYPKVLFMTSTKDDRVHPGHARKMAALMEEYGHDYLYYENTEGGHAGASNNKQSAYANALAYTYFIDQLIPKASEM